MTLRDLADHLACRLEGDGDLSIARVASLETAGPGDVSFFSNPRYARALAATRASAVIAAEGVAVPDGVAALRTRDPYVAFARALALLHPQPAPLVGVHPTAVVEAGVVLGEDVSIGPYAWIGAGAVLGARTVVRAHATVGEGAVLGDDCLLHPHVSIRERVTLGHRVVVQDHAVVGSDGFGFAADASGAMLKIPQVGTVVVGDDVEIGASTAIDRPPIGATVIGRGTKIDNLVQVAHGVELGERVILVSQVGIAGSTTVGAGTVLAGQVGVAGHLTIGKGVRATAQTGIPNSLPDKAFVSGYPAIDNRDWLKSSAVFRTLPALRRQVADLQRRLATLEGASAAEGEAGEETDGTA
ncbi:UDP-3-O-(3-hydroxymyristoyl)glucosamine N-acyltransferase [Luteitalea sp.]|uniref:UDP-3-O-(3-hydroxymyristoyl)glucosamine N-acyltransferase n=1 Tax=Luteitalea sp. TaxID=2004800 RepID=UPI0037C6E424